MYWLLAWHSRAKGKQSPALNLLSVYYMKQTSKLTLSITVVLLCASAVIDTGTGNCLTTGEEPVTPGIRKAILKEELENERGILVASTVPTYSVLRVLPGVLECVSKERVLYRKDKRRFHFLA